MRTEKIDVVISMLLEDNLFILLRFLKKVYNIFDLKMVT